MVHWHYERISALDVLKPPLPRSRYYGGYNKYVGGYWSASGVILRAERVYDMDEHSKTFIKSAFDSQGDLEYTIDHHLIRKWVSHWHGHPALASEPVAGSHTLLRLRFPKGPDEETPEAISWDEFFKRFDAEHLALQYVDEPRSSGSAVEPFARLVDRNLAQADSQTLAALSTEKAEEAPKSKAPDTAPEQQGSGEQ